jgi:hypothetical protein
MDDWNSESGESVPVLPNLLPPLSAEDEKDLHTTNVANRSAKKRPKGAKNEAAESDPGWAELSLKYLQYAKQLAHHSNVPLSSIRQLPSITHMIAISPENGIGECSWRWCDAYHAIKYLKDHGMVTTSRGAKGTSIKAEQNTVDDLIAQLQLQLRTQSLISEVDEQGVLKSNKSHIHSTVHVVVEQYSSEAGIEFDMEMGDIFSFTHLHDRIKAMLGSNLHDASDTTVQLLGYTDRCGDYIHANIFTSTSELIQDATEIHVNVL